MLKLRLIRHPEPQVAPGICYGATDLPAKAAAFEAQLQACLQMPRPALLLSSPLERCARLAEALGREGWPDPLIHRGLAEMSFGDWEMQPWKALDRSKVDAWVADIGRAVPPGGESVEQVARRARRGLSELLLPQLDEPHTRRLLLQESATVVVLCHFAVIQGLKHDVQGEPWSGFKSFKIGYGEHLDLNAPLAWLQAAN